MRVLFAGTPEVALPTLDALVAAGHDVVAVLTRPDAPSGRGRIVTSSPVAQRAQELGLPVLTPSTLRGEDAHILIAQTQADIAVVVAYGLLVPGALLGIPKHGWINLHFSLLPAWRGAAPVQRAIWNGDVESGVSVFALEEGLDTGPVYAQREYRLDPTCTSGEALDAMAREGADVVVGVVNAIANGSAVSVPQADLGISHAPRITRDEARIAWQGDAIAIDRQIRACTPQPGAWTTVQGVRVRIGPVTPDPRPARGPGVMYPEDGVVRVGTGTGSVTLGWVQPAGKGRMSAADWWRGLRIDEAQCE